MLEELKQIVCEANLELPKRGLITFTWGNVSAVDREKGLVVIKPSGVEYDGMSARDMVVVDFDGKVVEGQYKPSSDTPTHIELYRRFEEVGSIVHTHSTWATSWAQAGRDIPIYGTTHADYYYGPIPCTRPLSSDEIARDYELNTGKVIVETFRERKIDPMAVPGVIITNHGPFAWGKNAAKSVESAVVLEEVSKMAVITEAINPKVGPAPKELQDKHYFRKHGANAYYGQGN